MLRERLRVLVPSNMPYNMKIYTSTNKKYFLHLFLFHFLYKMTRHKNDQVRELLDNYWYQVINLPDDRRRNVIVFDAYSKKEWG